MLRRAVRGLAILSQDELSKRGSGRPYRRLLGYARPYWRGWVLIAAATMFSTIFALAQPWPMKIVVDNVLGGHALTEPLAGAISFLPGVDTPQGLLAWTVAAGLLLFMVNSVLDVILTFSWIRFGQRMVFDVAADLFARLQSRSLAFHSRNSVGDAMAGYLRLLAVVTHLL